MPLRSEEGDASCDLYFISAETPEEIGEKLFHVVTERIPKRFGFDSLRTSKS